MRDQMSGAKEPRPLSSVEKEGVQRANWPKREASMKKQSPGVLKTWQDRWFTLNGAAGLGLRYYQNKGDKAIGEVSIQEIDSVAQAKDVLTISLQNRDFVLKADTETLAAEWARDIQLCIRLYKQQQELITLLTDAVQQRSFDILNKTVDMCRTFGLDHSKLSEAQILLAQLKGDQEREEEVRERLQDEIARCKSGPFEGRAEQLRDAMKASKKFSSMLAGKGAAMIAEAEKLEQSLGMRDSLLTELAGVAKQAGGKLPPKGEKEILQKRVNDNLDALAALDIHGSAAAHPQSDCIDICKKRLDIWNSEDALCAKLKASLGKKPVDNAALDAQIKEAKDFIKMYPAHDLELLLDEADILLASANLQVQPPPALRTQILGI